MVVNFLHILHYKDSAKYCQPSNRWLAFIAANFKSSDFCIKVGHKNTPLTSLITVKFLPQISRYYSCFGRPLNESMLLLTPINLPASSMARLGRNLGRKKQNTVYIKLLITDPPKSREPLYSGQLTCPRLILQYISDTFQLQTMDTDQPPTYLSQYKITSENGQ